MYDMHHGLDIVAVGTVHGRDWAVTDDMLYAPGGDPANSTLSSPAMINEMEITATEMLDPHMPDGGFTVGFHVDVKHVAPAKPGAAIRTTAELLEVNGTKYTFHVEARDVEGNRLIGIGTHRRAALWPESSP